MTLLQYMPMPIIRDSGNSSPMTDSEVKVLLAIWILMNIIWGISWIWTLIAKFIFKRGNRWDSYGFCDRNDFWLPLYVVMLIAWVLYFLFLGGQLLSKFL